MTGADFILPVQIACTFGKTLIYGEPSHVCREQTTNPTKK